MRGERAPPRHTGEAEAETESACVRLLRARARGAHPGGRHRRLRLRLALHGHLAFRRPVLTCRARTPPTGLAPLLCARKGSVYSALTLAGCRGAVINETRLSSLGRLPAPSARPPTERQPPEAVCPQSADESQAAQRDLFSEDLGDLRSSVTIRGISAAKKRPKTARKPKEKRLLTHIHSQHASAHRRRSVAADVGVPCAMCGGDRASGAQRMLHLAMADFVTFSLNRRPQNTHNRA